MAGLPTRQEARPVHDLQRAQELHDLVGVFGLQLFDDMQVCRLRRRHVGVTESFGDRGDGDSCIEQQGRVRMTQTVNGDDWDATFLADGLQPVVHGGVEHALALGDEQRLIRLAIAAQTLEMHAEGPIHADFPPRGEILRRGKASFRILVVPCLLYIDLLRLKINVVGGQPERLPESQTGLGDQKKQIIIELIAIKLQGRKHCAELELIEILWPLLAGLFSFDDRFARWISTQHALVHGIHNGGLDLMVEIHDRLPLMRLCEVVENALVFQAAQVAQSHIWGKLFKMAQRHKILIQGDGGHGISLVRIDPFSKVASQKLLPVHMLVPFCRATTARQKGTYAFRRTSAAEGPSS